MIEAVSAYCERAARPSSSGEIRLALARLSPDRDREIFAICRKAPPASPLSPHGLVDIVLGMPPEQAASLERQGAYLALARQAAAEASEMQSAEARREAPKRPSQARRRRKEAGPPAPLVRRRAEVEARRQAAEAAPEVDEEPAAPPPRPGRRPAAPIFGRFVGGTPAKRPFSELEGPEGRQALLGFIKEFRGNPAAILERLDLSWSSPRGGRLGEVDLANLLEAHGLEEARAKAEREELRSLLRKHRGYEGGIAKALEVDRSVIIEKIQRYDLEDEVQEQRRRGKDEALREPSLKKRLSLLVRHSDRLHNLGVLRQVEQGVRREIFEAIDTTPIPEALSSPETLLELVRRELDLDRNAWERATEVLGLMGAAAHRLGQRRPSLK